MTDDVRKTHCDSETGARILGISHNAFRLRLSRGLIPESAIVNVGKALIFNRALLKEHAAWLKSDAERGTKMPSAKRRK